MNNKKGYTIDDLLLDNPVSLAMQESVPSFPDVGDGDATVIADLLSVGGPRRSWS